MLAIFALLPLSARAAEILSGTESSWTTHSMASHASETVSAPIQPTAPSNPPSVVPKGYEWGTFSESLLDADRQRIVTKYKNAGNWMQGIGLGPLPNISVADLSDDLASLRTEHGTQHLVNYNSDKLYYGPAAIGTPGQVLNVDVDTGSADLWVQSSCAGCNGAQFKPSKSRTFKDSTKAFHVQYGKGSATGSLGHDTVTIAGMTVREQYFGVVNKPSDDFKGTPSSGLLGLAFSSIASSRKPTFFENLLMTRPDVGPLFSVFLSRKTHGGSQVCFGCYDPDKARGGITWLPVTSKTYWTVAMTGALVDNHAVPATRTLSAAIDTGTTFVYIPDSLARALYARVPGARLATGGYYVAPCEAFTRLRVSLVFNGSPFSINMVDFNLGRMSVGSSYCVAGVLGLGDGFSDNVAIIGDEFLKSWYSTFDYTHGCRVGLSRSII